MINEKAEKHSDAIQLLLRNMTDLEQYPQTVLDYTSKYSSTAVQSYAPENLIGSPVIYPAYGDFPDTYMLRSYGKWWNESEGAQKPYMMQDEEDIISEDYITLGFEQEVVPKTIIIYETYNPGAVVRIWGRSRGKYGIRDWRLLWEGPPEKCAEESRKFTPPIREIKELVNELRIDFNQSLLNYHTSLDAVILAGVQPLNDLQAGLFRYGIFENPITRKEKHVQFGCDIDDRGNLFATLPYEVMVHIFQYLDLKSLCRCAQVNKTWYSASLDSSIYRELSLKRYWHTTDDKLLRQFIKRCRGLRKLDLSWCGIDGQLSEKVVIEFLRACCKHLKYLSFRHCRFVNNACIEEISQYSELVDLRLKDCWPDTGKLDCLAQLTKLVSLELYSTNIVDDALVKILRSNPNLKHLNIDSCERLSHLDLIAETIAYFNRNLVTWSSWKTKSLTSVGVGYLSRCPHLHELDLGWCLILKDPEDCLERVAQGCKDLRRLIISGWRGVTDHLLLPVIRSCKQLTQLDLLGIKTVSGDICDRALASLPKLQLLDISFCDSIKAEQVQVWRENYPNVSIQRSCESTIGDYWDN